MNVIQVRVKLIGVFARLLENRSSLSIDLEEGSNLNHCLRMVADGGDANFRRALLDCESNIHAEIVVLVNSEAILPSEINHKGLHDGDIVTLLPMVAGG